MRRAEGVLEHGDRPMPAQELGRYLDDLVRLNRWFGGFALSERAIWALLAPGASGRTLLVVDLGGGRGDLAMRLARGARRRGRRLRVLVVDRDEDALALGARAAKPTPDVVFVDADAIALPLRDGSVDVAVSALTLHHLEPHDVVTALARMRHVARSGVIVNDLARNRFSLLAVWLATRLFARHRYSWDDGPLSVRRAYSVRELRRFALRAGFTRVRVRRYPVLARVVMVAS
jgi:ubiquinone/menaquinone biosynthesis C-methylase UbiE